MVNLYKISLLAVFACICSTAFSQPQTGRKIVDVFLVFLEKKLPLTPQESSQMRPLVVNYFSDQKKIHHKNDDPLVREQQKVDLKIRYRNLFQPIIGTRRANRFFVEEQLFRKRIREELRQRKERKN